MTLDTTSIRAKWLARRKEPNPPHALELARELGVTEAELLSSTCGVPGEPAVTRLSADWAKLIARLPELGMVKAVSRNRYAVIEVEGNYDNVEFFGAMGQSVGSIDLRIFIRRWATGFAVQEPTKRGTSHGLQFFDASGLAIHKLFLRAESSQAAFAAIVRDFSAPDQTPGDAVEAVPVAPTATPDADIDLDGFRRAWSGMTDSHEFFGLLRKFRLERTQALRLAGEAFAYPVEPSSLTRTLEQARDKELPFMVFVGNPGVVQIFSGTIKRIVPMGAWINVLDPRFDLHVRTDRIRSAWVVRKPTTDGVVTSLELYTEDGEQLALLVGTRKSGQRENEAWRSLVESLPRLNDPCVPSSS